MGSSVFEAIMESGDSLRMYGPIRSPLLGLEAGHSLLRPWLPWKRREWKRRTVRRVEDGRMDVGKQATILAEIYKTITFHWQCLEWLIKSVVFKLCCLEFLKMEGIGTLGIRVSGSMAPIRTTTSTYFLHIGLPLKIHLRNNLWKNMLE